MLSKKNQTNHIIIAFLCFLTQSSVLIPHAFAKNPRLVIVGSTTMLPLSEHLATYYRKKVGVDVLVQGGGSSAGPIAVLNKIAQIAASSRTFTNEESKNLRVFVIAHDVLAIVVHSSNPIKNITMEQLRDVLAGKITNWKDLGAPFNKPIQLVNDSSGNGTRTAIEELVMGKSKDKKTSGTLITLRSVVSNSSSEMKANIANFKYAIGYLPFSYLDNTVKALSIDGVPPTYAAAYKESYPLFRDLLLASFDFRNIFSWHQNFHNRFPHPFRLDGIIDCLFDLFLVSRDHLDDIPSMHTNSAPIQRSTEIQFQHHSVRRG